MRGFSLLVWGFTTANSMPAQTCELQSKLLVSPLVVENQMEKKMENEMETATYMYICIYRVM